MRIPLLDGMVSRRVADEVRQFAEEVSNKPDKNPRKPPAAQLTFSQLMQYNASAARKRIGVYNPETISYTTFTKMGKHHQLAFGTAFIRLPLEKVEWWVECEDNDISAFLTQALRPIWRRLIKSSMAAIKYGFAPHEIIWKEMNDYRVWDKDKAVDFNMPTAFGFDRIKAVETSSVTLKLEEDRFAGFEQFGAGDVERSKAFLFTNEEEFGNIYGRSRYVYAYDPWYWSSIMVAFCHRYMERFASPVPVGKVPADFTNVGTLENPVDRNNLDLMQETLEAVREGSPVTIVSTSEGEAEWSIDLLTDDKRASEFKDLFDLYDAWMLRALFVPERALTQDAEVGSNSMASTHADMFIMSEESLIKDVADAVTDLLIPNLLLYNFGANAPEATVEVEGFTSDRKQLLKEIFVTMISSGQARPAAEELARELGVPMSEDAAEDDEADSGSEDPEGKPAPEQPTEKDVREAAATLSETHSEVRRLLSERKLQDARGCAC